MSLSELRRRSRKAQSCESLQRPRALASAIAPRRPHVRSGLEKSSQRVMELAACDPPSASGLPESGTFTMPITVRASVPSEPKAALLLFLPEPLHGELTKPGAVRYGLE